MIFRKIEFGSDDYAKECKLRDEVLRIPLGRRLCDDDLSAEKEQRHYGLFDENGNLVACAIAVSNSPTQAKVRQMAVSATRQSQGCGRMVMRGLEGELARSGHLHISLHARMSAVGFYEKLGYTRVGAEFSEVGIPHVRMEKRLPAPVDSVGLA